MTQSKIIVSNEVCGRAESIGRKTLNLGRCLQWGYSVPDFVAIPSFVTKEAFNDERVRADISCEADAVLKNKRYAVRSSALIEDGSKDSLAGQFLTRVNVEQCNLSQAIYDVLKHANEYLKGDLGSFSFFIQEYIEADISGITFTRNPSGGREMVVEYGNGRGEKVVGGEIKPCTRSFYWNKQPSSDFFGTASASRLIDIFKELERKMLFPQDIEWCVKGEQSYILQTRPITTLSNKQYGQIVFLDGVLPKKGKYFLEKTELSEIAPRPTPVTLDFLDRIYASGGPVDNVYRKKRVRYEDTKFMKIIGNELYVDKEKEIQGLLPAYGYGGIASVTPELQNYGKLLPTIRNLFFLNSIRTSQVEELFGKVQSALEKECSNDSGLEILLKTFLTDYELVFETNLHCGLSMKKASLAIRGQSVGYADVIASKEFFMPLTQLRIAPPQDLLGNSLDVSDESPFVAGEHMACGVSKKIIKWWENVSEYKKKYFKDRFIESIMYDRLRELGRWLTVKHVSAMRKFLLGYARSRGWNNERTVYFARLDEVMEGRADESICEKRKESYEKFNSYLFPNKLTSAVSKAGSMKTGVSFGIARGILCNKEMIDNKMFEKEKKILYTEILSPDLTRYFDRIEGVLSNNGGILSHLSIVARERNVPVVVGFSIRDDVIRLGDDVIINGADGSVTKKGD